jgi:DNA-binding IclR family transcriptional regulator
VNKLQGAIESIRQVIQTIGPAHARDIERHPEVVKACRSSKTKARRHIERLQQMGYVKSCGSAQMATFWVELE